MLLGAEDRPWRRNPDPANESSGWEFVVLHRVNSNQSACPSEASLAVNGHDSRLPLCYVEETLDNVLGRRGPIDEEEIGVIDSIPYKPICIILLLVQPNDSRDFEVLEHLDVVLRGVATAVVLAHVVEGTHKGDELVRDDPIEVTVLHSLVVLVLLVVELLEVVPAEFDCKFEPLEAMIDGAGVAALLGVRGVSERAELIVVGLEQLPDHCCRNLQHYDHEGTHEKGGIGLLLGLVGAIMINFYTLVLGIR